LDADRHANDTHESTTDPDAKLFRKGNGQPAKLCYMGHALMENRSGLVVQAHLGQASGTAEREVAIHMVHHLSPGSSRRITLGLEQFTSEKYGDRNRQYRNTDRQ
jgi:hypothetical protein